MQFEWHNAKNDENLRDHGIDFDWATRVFDDPYVLEYEDDYPFDARFNAIGMIDDYMVREPLAKLSCLTSDGSP